MSSSKTINWDATFEADPVNSDIIGEGNEAIQDVKEATRERLEQEHEMSLSESGPQPRQGLHVAGSARIYRQDAVPTTLPNGVSLGTSDAGRIWLKTTDMTLWIWSGTAWVQSQAITTGITDKNVTDAKLRDSLGLSVIGRAAATTGTVADISAASDGDVLRRSGTTIGFGTVATAGIAEDAVVNSRLANMAVNTIKGRITTGTGDPEDLSQANVRTIIGAGSGNGLDADLLDGKHVGTSGSVVPLLDGANTWSGIQAFEGGTSGSTSPFTVDSTTVVTNLNADKLDGADLSTDTALTSDSDILIPSQKAVKAYVDTKSGSATTSKDLTMNNGGSGDASPITFNGGTARTLSYNTLGAAKESHASSATTYGVSSATDYGHAKASATTPKMNDSVAVGSEDTAFARGDHVHPVDTSRAPTNHASTETTYGVSTASAYGHAKASGTTPIINGVAAVGDETASFARGNHVHPVDTSRAPEDHKSTATTYGVGDAANYGHVKVDLTAANGSLNAVSSDALYDETVLARNADNLTGGTVPLARIPAALFSIADGISSSDTNLTLPTLNVGEISCIAAYIRIQGGVAKSLNPPAVGSYSVALTSGSLNQISSGSSFGGTSTPASNGDYRWFVIYKRLS